ncbi:MAG TPA: hypothetical protein VFI34_00810 [Candidatus Limnocylindrales bacterium]|nr:hypothetical protein [Candidatus Limnocylindrales bacterium]
MAKDKAKGGAGKKAAKGDKPAAPVSAAEASGGQHHAAKAHGRPARIDEGLPATRAELLARHTEARKRRNDAPLGSEAFRAAVDEIGRIEVRIAAVDRAADPPLD